MSANLRIEGPIAFLTLARPEQGNRLDPATLRSISEALSEVETMDEAPSVLVLNAAGEDFCLGREHSPGTPQTPGAITLEFERIQAVNEQLQHSRLVTIAAMQGRAVGAGLSLAGRCDVVVVAEDARLSFPEVSHGIPPTIVLSHYRYVLPRNLLGDLIFTGRELSGSESVGAGIAARCVPTAELGSTVLSLAHQIAGYDNRTLALVKEFLKRTESLASRDAPALGIAMYAVEMAERETSSKGN